MLVTIGTPEERQQAKQSAHLRVINLRMERGLEVVEMKRYRGKEEEEDIIKSWQVIEVTSA